MRPKSQVAVALAMLLALVATSSLEAAESTSTVITVSEMCGGCVKRITAKLGEYSDIANVKCDIKTKTVTVTPKAKKTLSPRGLWEVMESIDKTPTRLAAPSGTFTTKPKK
jgi:copper chaperone CopZ